MVMTVDFYDLPAEGAPFVGERLERGRIFSTSALLQAVAVDDQCEIGELAVAGSHRGLPIAAFLQLAVAGDDEDAKGCVIDLAGDRNADSDRHSVAKRAGVGFDAGRMISIGM